MHAAGDDPRVGVVGEGGEAKLAIGLGEVTAGGGDFGTEEGFVGGGRGEGTLAKAAADLLDGSAIRRAHARRSDEGEQQREWEKGAESHGDLVGSSTVLAPTEREPCGETGVAVTIRAANGRLSECVLTPLAG